MVCNLYNPVLASVKPHLEVVQLSRRLSQPWHNSFFSFTAYGGVEVMQLSPLYHPEEGFEKSSLNMIPNFSKNGVQKFELPILGPFWVN
jgi:hypothetical protein